MSETNHNMDFDKELKSALGQPLPPDFASWRDAHPEAAAALTSQQMTLKINRNRNMKRLAKLAFTSAIVTMGLLGISFWSGNDVPGVVYADVIAQVNKAKTIQWKITFYNEVTGIDGKTKWLETKTRHRAYRAPGLFSEFVLDENGDVEWGKITDDVNLKEYSFNNKTKSAHLRELAFRSHELGKSPFEWVTDQNEGELQFVEKKQFGGRAVNVFRHIRKNVETQFRGEIGKWNMSYDFWLDAKTKKLVRFQFPGTDIFDPETDPIRNVPPQEKSSKTWGIGWVDSDLVFDEKLDDDLFYMKPPKGFEFHVEKRSYITEPEMIEFLGVLAQFRDGQFPEKTRDFSSTKEKSIPVGYSSPEINVIYRKPKADRSEIEQKLLDIVDHCKMNSLNLMPFRHFINDFTVDGTWRYAGKGVKLGEADRIVCWYQLKKTGQYRAVYGDLTVKDIAADDLPDDPQP